MFNKLVQLSGKNFFYYKQQITDDDHQCRRLHAAVSSDDVKEVDVLVQQLKMGKVDKEGRVLASADQQGRTVLYKVRSLAVMKILAQGFESLEDKEDQTNPLIKHAFFSSEPKSPLHHAIFFNRKNIVAELMRLVPKQYWLKLCDDTAIAVAKKYTMEKSFMRSVVKAMINISQQTQQDEQGSLEKFLLKWSLRDVLLEQHHATEVDKGILDFLLNGLEYLGSRWVPSLGKDWQYIEWFYKGDGILAALRKTNNVGFLEKVFPLSHPNTISWFKDAVTNTLLVRIEQTQDFKTLHELAACVQSPDTVDGFIVRYHRNFRHIHLFRSPTNTLTHLLNEIALRRQLILEQETINEQELTQIEL